MFNCYFTHCKFLSFNFLFYPTAPTFTPLYPIEHNASPPLTDQFGRDHNYLRISLTDKCNFRCVYCMPSEKMKFMPSKKLMTAEEIFTIAKTFTDLGVNKIRLTGGEPLVRLDFDDIIQKLSTLPVSLHMTTNALLLDKHIDSLVAAGLNNLNISIDSLDEQQFHKMTKVDAAKKVKENIELALSKGIHVKLNTVLMRGINDHEIIELVSLAKNNPLSVRFIEFMPFDGNAWERNKTIAHDEIIETVAKHFGEHPTALPSKANETAKNYQLKGFKGDFGIIGTVTKPFCESCNRIRITADGKLKNCLFASHEPDILTPLREGKEFLSIIRKTIFTKEKSRGGMETNEDFASDSVKHQNRSMVAIGG